MGGHGCIKKRFVSGFTIFAVKRTIQKIKLNNLITTLYQ